MSSLSASAPNDRHNPARQIPIGDLVHRRFQLIKMMIVDVWSLLSRTVNGIGRLDMPLHRGQGSAVLRVNQQCGREVIANIMLMSELAKVAFRGVLAVINLAPIVSQQHEI